MTTDAHETTAVDVVATIEVRPGQADAVLAIVQEYIDLVRAEEGCLRYDLYAVRREADVLVMVEQWASKDALRDHGSAAHFVEMSGRLAEHLAGAPSVRVLAPALVRARA